MAEQASPTGSSSAVVPSACPLPRVTIQFCTQCKWNLRAAYYAQELLSTFSNSLGEVALQPSTGGTFIVTIYHSSDPGTPSDAQSHSHVSSRVLWDRKTDLGFPETKELKRRVRDVIEPGRNLGHVDREYGKEKKKDGADAGANDGTKEKTAADEGKKCEVKSAGEACEDCN